MYRKNLISVGGGLSLSPVHIISLMFFVHACLLQGIRLDIAKICEYFQLSKQPSGGGSMDLQIVDEGCPVDPSKMPLISPNLATGRILSHW